jgi:hypothetical protein
MGRYEPLTRHLEASRTTEAPMTFREVERILNRDLPRSARLHPAWWSNTTTHSHAESWMRPGWKTARVDLAKERVIFVKEEPDGGGARSVIASGRSEAGQVVIQLTDLSGGARALLERHATELGCSLEQAIADLLAQAAIDRKRRLLERFPLSGQRSSLDSADLIREDRDAR